jgi:recombinational DNA repair protein (RecF pathway)
MTFERCAECSGVLGAIYFTTADGRNVHRRCRRQRNAGSPTTRLKRIDAELLHLEDEIREQASGSQDGYLLMIANKIREIRT